MLNSYILIFVPVILAILYSIYLIYWLMKQSQGNAAMIEISKAIREGSMAYLNRQYKTVAVVSIVLAIIIGFTLGWATSIAFLVKPGCIEIQFEGKSIGKNPRHL